MQGNGSTDVSEKEVPGSAEVSKYQGLSYESVPLRSWQISSLKSELGRKSIKVLKSCVTPIRFLLVAIE